MKFLLSPHLQQNAIIQDKLPEKYARHAIPGATIQYTEGSFGVIINQELKEDSYTLGEQLFFIKDETVLHPFTEVAMAALHSMLRGSISCILEGAGKVMLLESKYCLYYIPAGVKHTAVLRQGQYVSNYISITEQYLKHLVAPNKWLEPIYDNLRVNAETGIQLGPVLLSMDARTQLTKMKDCTRKGAQRDMYLQARLNDLLLAYIDQVQKSNFNEDSNVRKNSDAINDLVDYISENINLPLSIPSLAQHARMNVNAMERNFKKIHGCTLKTFIFILRMNRAKELIETTTEPISDIGMEVGYPDQAYFSTLFKKQTGLSPTDYKKQFLSGNHKSFPGSNNPKPNNYKKEK